MKARLLIDIASPFSLIIFINKKNTDKIHIIMLTLLCKGAQTSQEHDVSPMETEKSGRDLQTSV